MKNIRVPLPWVAKKLEIDPTTLRLLMKENKVDLGTVLTRKGHKSLYVIWSQKLKENFGIDYDKEVMTYD